MRAPIPYLALLALTHAGCTETTQLPYVADVRLDPDSVHLSPGESVEFRATPVGSNGEELPGRAHRVEWLVADETVVSVGEADSGRITVTADELGTGQLLATLGRGERTAPVFVQPPGLSAIAIDPPGAEVEFRARPRFRARLVDASGGELPPDGFRISWAVGDEDIALPTTTTGPLLEVFARGRGETTIRLVVADMTVSAQLVVE